MSADGLTAILKTMTPKEGAVTAPVPEGWAQGRTAYGGYTAALLLGAAESLCEDLPPLRSAVVNFTAPLSAPPRLTAQELRRGKNMVTVEARAEIGGETAALAALSFGKGLESVVTTDLPAPDAPSPEGLEPVIPPQAAAFAPAFMQRMDMRLIDGARPYSGVDEGYIRAWARLADPASRGTATALLCLADCLPPAVFPMLNKRVRNGSVNWICNLLTEDYGDADSWFQTESRLTAARDGYSTQVMRIWDQSGRLVVEGMQSVIVFG